MISFLLAMARRDTINRLRHGPGAPRYGERIWVSPRLCQRTIQDKARLRRAFGARSDLALSALVAGGDWDRETKCLFELRKVRACWAHWVEGVPWEDTGIYEHILSQVTRRGGRFDGCRNAEDVRRRYKRLDRIFATAQRERRLRTRQELGLTWPMQSGREPGGVFVHIGRDGAPIFGARGNHRLAMAKALDLPVVPVRIGIVHSLALERLPALRDPSAAD